MSPRACRNANSPDTVDRRRRTVRADTAPSPSSTTTTGTAVAPPQRWAVMKPSTSAAVTFAGALPTTAKNTFRSNAAASTVFGRHRAATNSR